MNVAALAAVLLLGQPQPVPGAPAVALPPRRDPLTGAKFDGLVGGKPYTLVLVPRGTRVEIKG